MILKDFLKIYDFIIQINLRRNRNTLEDLRRRQVNLYKTKLHIIVQNILSIPEVLRINHILSSVSHPHFYHINVLQLRADGNLFVPPKTDLQLYVQISGEIETVPGDFDLWRVPLVD